MTEESKNVDQAPAKQLSYAEVVNDPACLVYGQLQQKRKIGTWNSRWCAVRDGQFLCYKEENDPKPQVFFPLKGFQMNAIQIPQKPFAFQLSKPGIEHIFAASEWTDFQRWMQQLAKANVITNEADGDSESNTSKQQEEDKIAPVVGNEESIEDTEPPKEQPPPSEVPAVHVSQSVEETEPPKEKPGLHISHSFGSAEALLENSLHRSNEVEDLLSLQDTDLSSGSPALSSSLKRSHEVEDLRHLSDTEDVGVVLSKNHERSKSLIEVSAFTEDETMDPEAKVLLGVSVEQLKQLFNNDKDTTPPSPKPLFQSSNGPKAFKRANSLPQLPAEVHIEGTLNVAFELGQNAQWKTMWGTTKGECLYVMGREGAVQPRHVLPLDGVDVRPAALYTGRLLAVQLVRHGRMELIIEPPNVEELGRWVSTLFHIIQQASLTDNPETISFPPRYEVAPTRKSTWRSISTPDKEPHEFKRTHSDSSNHSAMITSPDGSGELVSVRHVASIFESKRSSSMNSSKSSNSANGRLNNHHEKYRKTSDFLLESDAQTIKDKLEARYADVVCWMGPYIEQEEERQVLSNVANPFLAKLRVRHKVEMISQLKNAATEAIKKIQNLEERLLNKEASKFTAAKQNQGRLVRNAEDARRIDNDKKRIEKECASIEAQINQEKRRLKDLEETIAVTEIEVKSAYQLIEAETSEIPLHFGENGVTKTDSDYDYEENGTETSAEMPEWTKKAKEKSQVWKKLSAEFN